MTAYFHVECSCQFRSDDYTTLDNAMFENPQALAEMIMSVHRRTNHYSTSSEYVTRIVKTESEAS